MSDTPHVTSLLTLATNRFTTLTESDKTFFRGAATRNTADYSNGIADKDDPLHSQNWGVERELAADRIAWLCTDSEASRFVAGDGIMVEGARVTGKLDLQFARVPFPLFFEKCAFMDEIHIRCATIPALYLEGTHTKGITADGLKAEGSVFLRNGFRADGEVNLVGATIGIDLECDGGQFFNKGKDAISADGLKVGGNVILRNKFAVEGSVRFINANISGYFIWADILSNQDVTLDLRSAKVGALSDDASSWPKADNLRLGGFDYHEFVTDGLTDLPTDAPRRIKWLRLQPHDRFRPQPYEQLASVLRRAGQEEDARAVLIAKNKDRARHTRAFRQDWFWYHVFGRIIGYGYRPWRAFWASLIIIALGTFLFEKANEANMMVPTKENAYVTSAAPGKRALSETYPPFYAPVYSLETFVPLIKLQQAEYWQPNANLVKQFAIRGIDIPLTGIFLRDYVWIHTIVGWILTTLWVGGLTGLIKT